MVHKIVAAFKGPLPELRNVIPSPISHNHRQCPIQLNSDTLKETIRDVFYAFFVIAPPHPKRREIIQKQSFIIAKSILGKNAYIV